MARRVPTEILRKIDCIPLFAHCSYKELVRVLSLGTTLLFEGGRTLTTEGDSGEEFFVTLSGSARCVRDGRAVAEFGAGDFFGEIALLDRGPRTATVTTELPAEIMVFSRREFNSLLASVPVVVQRMLPVVAGRGRLRSRTEYEDTLAVESSLRPIHTTTRHTGSHPSTHLAPAVGCRTLG
jgi:CRP/FNR family transcriptional regulator, cyclic AMP receptor protein